MSAAALGSSAPASAPPKVSALEKDLNPRAAPENFDETMPQPAADTAAFF